MEAGTADRAGLCAVHRDAESQHAACGRIAHRPCDGACAPVLPSAQREPTARYVEYPIDDLAAIVALESRRARW